MSKAAAAPEIPAPAAAPSVPAPEKIKNEGSGAAILISAGIFGLVFWLGLRANRLLKEQERRFRHFGSSETA